MAKFKIHQYSRKGYETFVSIKHRGEVIERIDTRQTPVYAHGVKFTGHRSILADGYFLPLTVGRVSPFDQILLTTDPVAPSAFLNRLDEPLFEAGGITIVNGECYLSLGWPRITELMTYSVNGYKRADSFKPEPA